MTQAYSAKMSCPVCDAVIPVGGHCLLCFSRLPIGRDRLVACSRCNRLVPIEAEWCPGCHSSRFADARPPIPAASVSAAEVWTFTSMEPGGGDEWRKRCRALGKDTPEVLLEILRSGDDGQRYAAILALRVHGYEAYGVGIPVITEFKIRAPNSEEFETIVPSTPDEVRE